jgi:ribulose-phosphate 3-epimerase
MVQHPQEVGHQFIDAGVQRVVAQVEGFRKGEVARVCNEWRERGVEVGISIMLDTPLDDASFLVASGLVSVVQVMSIAHIGYQGTSFDERALVRIRELRDRYPDVTIAVDGGVNKDTLEPLLDAGATVFGIGSAIMKTEDPKASFVRFQELLNVYAQRFQNSGA